MAAAKIDDMMDYMINNMIARSIATLILSVALCEYGAPARADTRLDAHFVISMIAVPIGQLTWMVEFSPDAYATSANGKASGALSMLVKGDGRISTRGMIDADGLKPTFFSSNVTDDDGTVGLQMSIDNGAVKTLHSNEPPPKNDDRVAVTEADRNNVIDPLTAMLIMARPGDVGSVPELCNRILPVFDGQRRYDLALSFKRLDKLKVDHGYAGPVLVCAVVLKPVSGYRADSMLVKYAAGRRGMEIWFAPIIGTSVVAPARLVMPTLLGTLEIDADRFVAGMLEPATAPDPASRQ